MKIFKFLLIPVLLLIFNSNLFAEDFYLDSPRNKGMLRFEINVRESAVMGFVGAGGIGQDLIEAIRKFYYSDVSAILVLILITVAAIDTVTSRIRHRLIGLKEKH